MPCSIIAGILLMISACFTVIGFFKRVNPPLLLILIIIVIVIAHGISLILNLCWNGTMASMNFIKAHANYECKRVRKYDVKVYKSFSLIRFKVQWLFIVNSNTFLYIMGNVLAQNVLSLLITYRT